MRIKKLIVLTILSILLVSTMACGEGGGPAATPTPVPTPTPTPEPTTTPTPQPTTEGPLPQLQVYFLDVGQGDSILIDQGETEVLIDGGGRSPGVVAYLEKYIDGALEVMIGTHPHADYPGAPNPATSGSGLSVHWDKLYGGVTKGEVLTLTRFRASDWGSGTEGYRDATASAQL